MARSFRYLKDSEKSAIAAALRIARDVYRKDAADLAASDTKMACDRLLTQFLRQSDEAESLADLFDSYPEVEIDTAA